MGLCLLHTQLTISDMSLVVCEVDFQSLFIHSWEAHRYHVGH